MEIEFNNIEVKTVGSDYSWDRYNPHKAIIQDAQETDTEIVGYAPFVNVRLSATPTDLTEGTLLLVNKIDFGDYYNSETNTQTSSLCTTSEFCHNYIMPGEYTITVEVLEYVQTNRPSCTRTPEPTQIPTNTPESSPTPTPTLTTSQTEPVPTPSPTALLPTPTTSVPPLTSAVVNTTMTYFGEPLYYGGEPILYSPV